MKPDRQLLLFLLLVGVLPVKGQTPTSAKDYNNRGAARQRKGDLDGAIADYTRAINIDPRLVPPYTNRGAARQRKGDLDGAIADYTKAIDVDPRHADAYTGRGVARRAKGDLDGAIADYTKAIDVDPNHSNAYSNRANARKAKGDLDGAIADYAKAIDVDPRNVAAYNNLAWLWATASKDEARDGKRAVEYARKAAKLTNWQDPNSLATLAAAYAETGNFEEAIKWQTKALAFPQYAERNGELARPRLQLYVQRKPYRQR